MQHSRSAVWLGVAATLVACRGWAQPVGSSAEIVAWFQETEQKLMDSIAVGDTAPWERVMDEGCVVTTEEGELIPKQEFLKQLKPLPNGLTGAIQVKELTVQEFPTFASVRFLADECELVFGQRLATQYRMTDTFRRDGTEWKLVASHASVVTRDPPQQVVSRDGWPGFVGRYRLLPDGWTFSVELRGGELYGGRDPHRMKRFVPMTANAFVLSGQLGEWIFVTDERGRAIKILELRKFEPLVWSRDPS